MGKFHKLLITIILCTSGSTSLLSAHNAQASIYPAIWGDNTYEWITNVTFGTINNSTSQDTNGYGDYTFDRTNFMTQVQPGITYPLSVTIHPDVKWCDEYLSVFFDWNHDNDFTDSGETFAVASDTCDASPHTVNIKVPSNATGGETRMRVVLKYYNAPPSSGDIPEGEAEDYTIIINYPTITGDNRSEWITNVTFEDINNITGRDTNGYLDYSFWATGKQTETYRGESYPLSVTISPDLFWCDENITVFFDWNHDGDFDDKSEIKEIISNTCSPGPHWSSINVPKNASLGRTQMRVVLNWNYTPPSSGHISGEGEDYTLFVNGKFSWALFMPAIIKYN